MMGFKKENKEQAIEHINTVLNCSFQFKVVVRDSGYILGAASFSVKEDIVTIHNVGSLKNGIGTILMNTIESYAESLCCYIQLCAPSGHPFYLKRGYDEFDDGMLYSKYYKF